MSDQDQPSSIHTWLHHTGSIWENATDRPQRRQGPGTNFPSIDTLKAGQPLIVLCYSRGERVSFRAADGQTYTSDAWDFVETFDQDPGGYIADVFVNTGGEIAGQLGDQGRCSILKQRLANS